MIQFPRTQRNPGLSLLGLIVSLFTVVPLAALEAPRTVSPGLEGELVGSPTACPPLSWTLVDDAEAYELSVFRIDDPEEVSSVLSDRYDAIERAFQLGDPVWRQTLPGGANHWLPASHQCLAPGFYFWAVRAEFASGWSDWSRPAFFSTPGTMIRSVHPAAPVPVSTQPEIERLTTPAALSADGLIESTDGGFRFPDDSEQEKAFTREVFHVQVAADGSKLTGNVVSTAKDSTGFYLVNLGRLAIGCSAVGDGAAYDPGLTFVLPKIVVTTVVYPASFTIQVHLWAAVGGAPVDSAFQLIVVCPPFSLF